MRQGTLKMLCAELLLISSLTSCSGGVSPSASEFCQVAGGPIRPTTNELDGLKEMPSLVEQILAYNKKGAARCGWKP
jgi:hypothetical protein